jgi:hypothetical protein
MNFSTGLGGLMGAILSFSVQALAHDHLPDMTSGVWKMNKVKTWYLPDGPQNEVITDGTFNIDYFLPTPLTCKQDICYVQKSADDGTNIYPAIGKYIDGRILLTTEMSTRVKTETYVAVSDRIVLMSGSIVDKISNKPSVIYNYAFLRVE